MFWTIFIIFWWCYTLAWYPGSAKMALLDHLLSTLKMPGNIVEDGGWTPNPKDRSRGVQYGYWALKSLFWTIIFILYRTIVIKMSCAASVKTWLFAILTIFPLFLRWKSAENAPKLRKRGISWYSRTVGHSLVMMACSKVGTDFLKLFGLVFGVPYPSVVPRERQNQAEWPSWTTLFPHSKCWGI